MQWEDDRRSDNVEDRRGLGARRGVQLGGGAAIVAIVLTLLGAPRELIQILTNPAVEQQPQQRPVSRRPPPPGQDKAADFVSAVLGQTEDTWEPIFQRAGRRYQRPKLVLFSDAVDSACGYASAAVGPFYCPPDRQVYLDLAFFEELDRRFGAPGDFAQGYVIAHEIGHHVQNLLGFNKGSRGNEASVRLELQADCLAGIWGFAQRGRKKLDAGDLEEALKAATAIGDDTLQRKARGRVMPETFTHGSAEQRVRWFRRGFESGDVSACDATKAERL